MTVTLFLPNPFEFGIKDSREVFKILSHAGVPFKSLHVSDAEEPKLNYGYSEHRGLNQIKKFIENWKRPRKKEDEHCDCGISGD